MPNDIRSPQDDSRLFENLEAKLGRHDAEATAAWDAMKLCQTGSSGWKKALGKFEYHAERARHIRAKLRRGEREPAF